jgi:hypothetical protein
MHFKIVAFFLCTGVTAICQATAPATPEKRGGIQQDAQLGTNCLTERLTPGFSVPSFALQTGDRQSSASPRWDWNDTQVHSKNVFRAPVPGSAGQVNSKNAFPSLVLNSEAKSCTLVAQSGLPGSDQTLFKQWPNAKTEPIPTEWPNAKIEKIPTEWPNLKFVPVHTSTMTPPPSK